LSELLDLGRRGHRTWVRWAFSPQLGRRRGAKRTQLEDLLVVATDVYTWKLLRIDRRLSERATRAAMTELCEAVVARGAGSSSPPGTAVGRSRPSSDSPPSSSLGATRSSC